MRKWILIIVCILVVLIVALAGSGYLWLQYTLKNRLPQTNGIVSLAGLRQDVKVIRDTYGVPHIYAKNMDRISRITQLLTEKQRLSIDDMKAIQNDVFCPLASELVPEFVRVMKKNKNNEAFKKALPILSNWDIVMNDNSPAAAIFETTFQKLMANIFSDELGKELYPKYLETVMFPPRAIRAIFRKGQSPWFDDVSTPQRESKEDIVKISLEQALNQLKSQMGEDMAEWQWGKIHTLTYSHVLGKKKPLRLFYCLI